MALTPEGERLAKEAVQAIVGDATGIRNAQDREAGAGTRPVALQAAIEDVLRGASPFYPGRDQASQRSFASSQQLEALGRVAGELDFGQETDRGGEHVIYRQLGTPVVYKKTLPRAYGYGYTLAVENGQVWQRRKRNAGHL